MDTNMELELQVTRYLSMFLSYTHYKIAILSMYIS